MGCDINALGRGYLKEGMKKSGWIRNWEDWTYSQEYHLVPEEMTGSHGDPAHSVNGQVLTAQPGARSSLRTGASLSSHIRVTWRRHAQPSAGYPGALLSLQHVSRCRPPLQGGTARARGGLALSPHASLLTTAALSQSHLDMHRDEEMVQGGTEGEGPGASKGRPHLQTKDCSYCTLTRGSRADGADGPNWGRLANSLPRAAEGKNC